MKVRARVSVFVGLVVFLAFALGAPFGLPALKTVVGADRILRGEVPYRDFWTMYAPGSFYAVAGAMRLFGRELLVQSLCAALSMGLAAGLWADTIRCGGASRRLVGLLGFLFLAMLWSPGLEWSSYPSALPFLLFAVRGVHRRLTGLPSNLFVAGMALGLAATCKHDVAGYAAIALGLALLAGGRSGVREAGRGFWHLASGAIATALPVVLWFVWTAGGEIWNDLVVFPGTDFPKIFADPYPAWAPPLALFAEWLGDPGNLRLGQGAFLALNAWVGCVMPHAFFWPALAWLLLRGSSWEAAQRCCVIAWLLWIPFFWMAAHVQQNTHVWSMAFGCFGLWAVAWSAAKSLGARAALGLVLALYAGGHAVRPAMSLFLLAQNASGLQALDLPGARGVFVSESDAHLFGELIGRIQADVPPGEPIHVGVARHDAVVISNQRFYFLADRPCATRYNELHPGITDRDSVQREMVQAMQESGARYAIIWHFGWPADRLDRIREKRQLVIDDAGSTRFDDYLDERFVEERRIGQYSLRRRRD